MCKTKNIHTYDARKVAKCQDAKLNGLGVIKKNLRYVESAPPRKVPKIVIEFARLVLVCYGAVPTLTNGQIEISY